MIARLTSTAWWDAPGMARNYVRVMADPSIDMKLKDGRGALKTMVEGAYEERPEVLPKLAAGEFTVEGESVLVELEDE